MQFAFAYRGLSEYLSSPLIRRPLYMQLRLSTLEALVMPGAADRDEVPKVTVNSANEARALLEQAIVALIADGHNTAAAHAQMALDVYVEAISDSDLTFDV